MYPAEIEKSWAIRLHTPLDNVHDFEKKLVTINWFVLHSNQSLYAYPQDRQKSQIKEKQAPRKKASHFNNENTLQHEWRRSEDYFRIQHPHCKVLWLNLFEI